MKKIEITLYSFDELSDTAKEMAINDNRERFGCNDAMFVDDDYCESLKEIEDKFGIYVKDIEHRGYSRFRIKGRWQELADTPKFLIRYVDELSDKLHKGKYYSTPMHMRDDGKYDYKCKYSKVLSGYYSCCLTGTYTDFAVDCALVNRYCYVKKNYTIREFIDSVLDDFCSSWLEHNRDCFTDEYIRERIIDNGCMFLKSGKLFNNIVC